MSWFSKRSNLLWMFLILLMLLLIGQLYVLTGLQNEKWSNQAETNTVRYIYTDAPRGEIYDRNGVLLAGNIPSFAVYLSKNDMNNEALNKTASALIAILEKHEETWLDNFPIVLIDGAFSYTYDDEIAQWLISEGMPSNYTAAQAFSELRQLHGISTLLDDFAAQEALNAIGINPPISVKSMEFNAQRDKRQFLERFGITDEGDEKDPDSITNGTNTPAAVAFSVIRSDYKIKTYLPDEEARKIMTFRHELSSMGYYKYLPTMITYGISQETVIEIEEKLHELPGVSLQTESMRYYPNGHNASHIMGYLGRISEDDKTKYEELLYRPTDLIGKDGIEAAEEELLHGVKGQKQVIVNSSGEMIGTVGEETTAQQGKDIALTIDLRLQQVAEDTLPRALEAIRTAGVYQSKYGDYKISTAYPNAQVAAVVALDAKTGEVLALANYPDYDPNVFTDGISADEWKSLQSTNPRDPLSPRPLYNVATMTAVQPGSTFKPITAITALEFGLDSNRKLYDGGYIQIGNQIYSCLAWGRSGGTHGSVNLFTAMQVSCNYYFFDLGTGRDWYKGIDLGYEGMISIDKITDYAKQFGLGVKSGIEIPESNLESAPTAASKMASTKNLLRNYLIGQAETVFPDEILKDPDSMLEKIEEIVSWADENPKVSDIRSRLIELGAIKTEAQTLAENVKYTYYNYAQWTRGDELNISIGQGENAYTPLQMANYIATIGNGGTLNNVTLIKAVEGEGEIEHKPGVPANISDPQHIKDVITALRMVVAGGTLNRGISGLSVAAAGKSGTAQRGGYVNTPDETEYIREHLSGINPTLKWETVESEMLRLMREYPTIYSSKNIAVRRAVINLSGAGFNPERLDAFKSAYDDFGWVITMAPYDDPEIAVAALVVQGGSSGSVNPIVMEVIGAYFDLKAEDAASETAKMDYEKFFEEDHRADSK